jgi:serine protease Do
MIFSDQQGSGNLGVGFAVPINEVHSLVPSLKTGKVARGRLGVLVDRRPIKPADRQAWGLPATGGALITRVDSGPAHDGGVQAGDFAVEFNGKPVVDDSDLVEMVTSTAPGTTVPVKVYRYRDRKLATLNVKVGELDLNQEENPALAPQAASQNQRRTALTAQPKATGFGLMLSDVEASVAQLVGLPAGRSGALVTAVDQNNPSAGRIFPWSMRGILPDVILAINGKTVTSRDQAVAAIDAVPANLSAILLVWRDSGEEVVILPKK